jgi:hypothetical protein
MVYGYGDTSYEAVAIDLEDRDDTPIKKVYNCMIGDPNSTASVHFEHISPQIKPSEESEEIEDNPEDYISYICKTALANLFLENYKRVGVSGIPSKLPRHLDSVFLPQKLLYIL